jgi:WD40 repeat protein
VSNFQCHNSHIACLALNSEATLLATASENGTTVKIFDTKTQKELFELRRGSTYAQICHLSFDSTSSLLSCCSKKDKIHVFKINKDGNQKSKFSMFSSLVQYAGSEWNFASLEIQSQATKLAFI